MIELNQNRISVEISFRVEGNRVGVLQSSIWAYWLCMTDADPFHVNTHGATFIINRIFRVEKTGLFA